MEGELAGLALEEGDVAAVEPEGAAAADDPAEERQAPDVPADDILKSSFDQWFVTLGKDVAFADVDFDTERKHGQVRVLNPKNVETKVKAFRARMPKEPLRITAWPVNIQSMLQLECAAAQNSLPLSSSAVTKFLIISGQHGAKALMVIRQQYEKDNIPLIPALQTFRADILQHSCLYEVREFLAGMSSTGSRGSRA